MNGKNREQRKTSKSQVSHSNSQLFWLFIASQHEIVQNKQYFCFPYESPFGQGS